MLLLHSLLTHLHGQAQGAANGGVSQDLALDMALLQPSTDLFNALPGSSRGRTVERLSASYLRDRCPVIHQLMSRTTEAPHLPRSLTLSGLLIEILYLETADFLQDLEETDAAIIVSSALVAVNGSVAGAASPIAAKAGAAGSSGTPQLPRTPSTARVAGSSSSSKMASPAAPRGSTGKSRSESSMPIPVAELVVAAHAALLLHTLETNTTEGDKQKKQITSGADLRSALAALPRGDWWLCTRVLKAFLNLQGQVLYIFLFIL